MLSFQVNQRTREVGLRVALGATPARVLRLVMQQGMKQLALGMAIGVVMAYGLGRLLSLLLFEVGAADPTVFVTIVVVLAATGMLASLLPALRATRGDPTVAIRAEQKNAGPGKSRPVAKKCGRLFHCSRPGRIAVLFLY